MAEIALAERIGSSFFGCVSDTHDVEGQYPQAFAPGFVVDRRPTPALFTSPYLSHEEEI